MRSFLEGSRAVAEAVARCRPAVVPAYPITPQTHIVEALGAFIKAGELPGSQFLTVDSEFAAMSAAIGATGARTYTPWYYSEAPRTLQPVLRAARRVADFSEVVGGLDADTALFEARRCLSCGNCFGCDNCYGVCPDNAVIKIDGAHGYAIDYDYCKGCGLCAAECPSGAITMRPEQI